MYLRDIYWAEEGRSSFDAVVITTVIGGLILLGLAPFDLPNNTSSVSTWVLSILTDVILAALAILKGRRFLGLVGVFVPPVSLVCALRLGSPDSPWAHRFYKPDGGKLLRAQARYQRIAQRRRRLADGIAGAPSTPANRGATATQGDSAHPPPVSQEADAPAGEPPS